MALDRILQAQKEINQVDIENQLQDDKESFINYEQAQQESLQQQIIRRFKNEQLQATLDGDTQYLAKLRFFMQYPPKVRQQLIEIGILEQEQWNEAGKVIFRQGGHSDYYYVIVKGTVQIEQVPSRFEAVKDMPPIVKRTCYDGDQFGELSQFKKNIQEFETDDKYAKNELAKKQTLKQVEKINGIMKQAISQLNGDNNDLDDLNHKGTEVNQEESDFEVTENMTKDLTEAQVNQLNAHQETATTMEPCILLKIDKLKSMRIISETLKSDYFLEKVRFLWKIDLFHGINKNHMLPLISNLIVKKFRKGQYIQREGEEPEGLIIIRKGHCLVCTEKLSMRRVDPKHMGNNEDDEKTKENEEFWASNPQELRELNAQKVYQSKLEHIDDDNKKIRKDTLIYKDLLPFENLYIGQYFGGRTLLARNKMRNIRKQILRQENLIRTVRSTSQSRREKGGKETQESDRQEKSTIIDKLTKQLHGEMQSEISSYLSVVANSARVELWVIDEDVLNLLPQSARAIVLKRLQRI